MSEPNDVGSASTRKKLLVITSTFPRWRGDVEPRFVEYLAYEQAERFDVVVLSPHCQGSARDELFTDGKRCVVVHRFRYCFAALQSLAYEGGFLAQLKRNPLRFLLVPFYVVFQMLSVWKLHRQYQFDAIHAHWIIPQGLVVATLKLILRDFPPWLVTSHGGDLFALRGSVIESVKRWVLESADAISVVSEAMRDYCMNMGIAPERIVVQSMGVDLTKKFTPGDVNAPRSGLIYVGRLVDKKGVSFLVDAMSILNARCPNLQLKIVGDGPLCERLIKQVNNAGATRNISFIGSVPNEKIPDHLRAASIAVMPSIVAPSGDQEGLGLVAVEALGCGCAVVASDLPAVSDVIINGETGLTVAPENSQDLAEKIMRLLDDEGLRKRLAEQGRKYVVENFDWRVVGKSYARLTSELRG